MTIKVRKKEIQDICNILEQYWLVNSDQRFGQFLFNTIELNGFGELFYMPDSQILESILNYNYNIRELEKLDNKELNENCHKDLCITKSAKVKKIKSKQVNVKIDKVKELEFEPIEENKYYQSTIDWTKIKTNRILRCKKCKTLIQSHYRHDFVQCECGSIFVDGGSDYVRYGGKEEDIEFISETDAERYYLPIKEK